KLFEEQINAQVVGTATNGREALKFLDPYKHLCEVKDDGTVSIAQVISEKEVAEGIIDCAWMVIDDNRLHKKFRSALLEMEYQEVFEAQGIHLEQ
ncbi:MAG: hypothetical protein D3905_08620, partial [Candidatus Electrothrix sp. AS4_5]|nr:hypothetical protein [Candidatus Electrothrix gigas]